MLVCRECGNKDTLLFAKKKNAFYCRRCISFPMEKVVYHQRQDNQGEMVLAYSLTDAQKELARKLILFYQKGENCLIHAVCGSGKTEIVYPLIEYALKGHQRVGFAIPRKDVVIELVDRIQKVFPKNKVVALYGGHNQEQEGDIIVLTMHQISRYNHYFDLLIADEIDAFPFKDNPLLENFFFRANRGMIVMMSATPSLKWKKHFDDDHILTLNRRFHGAPIPLPQIVILSKFPRLIYLLKKLRYFIKAAKPCLIFVSSIQKSENLSFLLRFFFPKGTYVHSKRENRQKIIDDFKKKRLHYLVTTSILERGITIASLQVIIYDAEQSIYNAAVLEQISGRVGRKKEDPHGEVIYLATTKTFAMEKAYQAIQGHNEGL